MHITLGSFEFRVAEITPEDASHAQLMRVRKRFGDFLNLARRFIRTEIDGRADGDGAEVFRFLHRSKQDLVELVRKRQQLVMINFHDERNLVGILSRDAAEYSERRSHPIASAVDRQLHNVAGIEILWVRRKGSARRMLNALVDRQDRNVSRAGQPPMIQQGLQRPQDRRRPIGLRTNAVDKIRPGQMKLALRDRL